MVSAPTNAFFAVRAAAGVLEWQQVLFVVALQNEAQDH